MGYYTDFTLSVYSAEKTRSGSLKMSDNISPLMEQLIDEEIDKMNIFSDGNIKDSYYTNAKWYDHEDDMKLLSAKFPDMVFWLSGQGENQEDLWQKFFVNGRMQECYAQIVYDDFDSNKLVGDPITDISERKYSYQS